MILNNKNSDFYVNFPKNFFDKKVVHEYEKNYFHKTYLPYDNISDFINSSIQSIEIPGISAETVSQTLNKLPTKWKSGWEAQEQIGKELTVSFKHTEGYMNYWFLAENLLSYYAYNNNEEFSCDLVVRFLDANGDHLLSVHFLQAICKGISDMSLSYSSNTFDFKDFSLTFEYNRFRVTNMFKEKFEE